MMAMTRLAGRLSGFFFAASLFAAAVTPAAAEVPHTDFALGRTDAGAICTAVLNLDDAAGQLRGARAWDIRCRGFDGVFGHVYVYEDGGAAAVAAGGLWQKSLAARADCSGAQPVPMAGLKNAQEAVCKKTHSTVEYRAWSAVDGDRAAAAESFAPIAPLAELALRIAMNAADVPQSDLQTQSGGGDSGGELDKLLEAATAAQDSGDYLNTRAQTENKGWEFADAERDFRALEESTSLSERDRLLAEYNVALNVSDEGPNKFDEANKLFASANAKAAKLHDPEIKALSLNYQALHYLNERHFADAITAATAALVARQSIDPNLEQGGTQAQATVDSADDSIVVSQQLAADLNSSNRTMGLRVFVLTPVERLQIQNAQAQYVIGAAKSRLGDLTGSRVALEEADRTLSSGRLATARSTGGCMPRSISSSAISSCAQAMRASGPPISTRPSRSANAWRASTRRPSKATSTSISPAPKPNSARTMRRSPITGAASSSSAAAVAMRAKPAT